MIYLPETVTSLPLLFHIAFGSGWNGRWSRTRPRLSRPARSIWSYKRRQRPSSPARGYLREAYDKNDRSPSDTSVHPLLIFNLTSKKLLFFPFPPLSNDLPWEVAGFGASFGVKWILRRLGNHMDPKNHLPWNPLLHSLGHRKYRCTFWSHMQHKIGMGRMWCKRMSSH